ncbi:hypothetical protein DEIPH_ctg005orf0028 [Deinococcus phoenicis]|uniref:Glycoside hydrolase family 42 N-terminal domain-containing protein n=1 Tax=Deinococcus phoenicis TaxID=1476583 RepID=A0A016QTT5_9DEIO|nr:hypothetical protein [Deinococcus phoenicis]EYB69473.1 hypothetical protein DEIPH_ctg005orf0028 [Deinococcus phoenicis]
MRRIGTLACALTLLLAACSQTPNVPTTAALPTGESATGNGGVDEVQASDAAAQAATQRLQALGAATTQTTPAGISVQAGGTLTIGGQPMFPMGFYHVSWAGNAERRLRDMQAIADMGFNVMNAAMFDAQDDIPGFQALLRSAQSRGMKLLVEDFNAVSIAALKNEPALLGWMIGDDCNSLLTPQQLQERHRATKALDPGHLTYASMAITFANSHAAYFGKSDAVGNQSYPVDGGDEVGVVYPVMKRLVEESRANGTLPIANLQSFRWKDGRLPNARELYSMTNQALGAGVKGILYYTYLDQTNDLATQPALRTELKRLAGEVKLLSPFLLEGQRQDLNAGSLEARATLWTYKGHRYLQVLSLSETARQNVKITLGEKTAQLVPLLAGRPTGLQLKNGAVTGALTPLTAQWYELR